MNVKTFGEVKFNFHFDPIFDSPENSWMKEQTQEIADLLGSVIKQNAEINIQVKATLSGKGLYAIAGFNPLIFPLHQGLGLAHPPVRLNIVNIGEFDGYIDLDLIKANNESVNYQRVIVHELTHILGFEGMARLFDMDDNLRIGGFLLFDTFIFSQDGEPLIIRDGKITKVNLSFNPNGLVFACGENIRKRNEGDCVKLFNKRHYPNIGGNSFIHLDPKAYKGNIMNPGTDFVTYSFWNKYEVGIMEDLGYEIDFEEFCKVYADLHLNLMDYQEIDLAPNACPQNSLSWLLLRVDEYTAAPIECRDSDNFNKGDRLAIIRIEDRVPLVVAEIGNDGYGEGYIGDDFYRIVFEVLGGDEGVLRYDLYCIKVEKPTSSRYVFD